MLRLRLEIAYDGSEFHGWAMQASGLRTVQAEVQRGLEKVLRLPEGSCALTVAGRTDAGVHATGQVAHVDVPRDAFLATPGRSDHSPEYALILRMAGVLPADVRLRSARVVSVDFDARFSAIWRRYTYRLSDDPSGLPPLRRHDVLQVKPAKRRLDVAAMDEAAASLVGLNDFAAFCKWRDGASTIRTLMAYSWRRDEETGLLLGHVQADAFCHSMVRALVGAVIPVGVGRKAVSWPAEIMAGRKRVSDISVVGPQGLTLEEVAYPPDDQLAQRAEQARRMRAEEDLQALG